LTHRQRVDIFALQVETGVSSL